MLIMLLNLNYGYIPYVFPYFIAGLQKGASVWIIGFIKAGIAIGEIIGSLILVKCGAYVSLCTKLGLMASAVCMLALYGAREQSLFIAAVFVCYGLADTLTQPLYSYVISSIPSQQRGTVLGGIDFLLYLVAPAGMLLGGVISRFGLLPSCLYISLIFLIALAVLQYSRSLSHVSLNKH